MPIVIRLLTAAVLAYVAAATAEDGAALPEPAADYLARATRQGTWPQLSVAYLAQSARTFSDFPSGANATETREPLMLGDGAAALTGLLLADLASSGRIRLDDPISRFLPAR